MGSLNAFAMKSNRKFKINFDGDDLSSGAGLLLIKEFAAKISFEHLVKKRFFNRMDEDTMSQMNKISRVMRRIVYSINSPEYLLPDLDSTLLDTFE